MQTLQLLVRLIVIIVATLFSVTLLIRLVYRLPGVVVALSIIALLLFGIAFIKGSPSILGIRSRKVAVLAMVFMFILLILSTVILFNVN